MTVTPSKLDTAPPAWVTKAWDLSGTIPGEVVHDGQHVALTAPDNAVVMSANLSQILEADYECTVEMTVAGQDFSSFPVTRTPEFTASVRRFADTLDTEYAKALGLPANAILTPLDSTAAIRQLARDALMGAAASDGPPLPSVRAMLAADEIVTAVVEAKAEVSEVCDRAQGMKPRPKSDEFLSATTYLVGETLRRTYREDLAAGGDGAGAVKRMQRALHLLANVFGDEILSGPDGAADG